MTLMKRRRLACCVLVAAGLMVGAPARAAETPTACTEFAPTAPITAIGTSFLDVTTWGDDRAWVAGLSYGPAGSLAVPLVERWDGKEWQVVQGRPTDLFAVFNNITATGPADLWATGTRYLDTSGFNVAPLLVHITGQRWSIEALPTQTTLTSIGPIYGAAAHDVWVIATTMVGGYSQPVIFHRVGAHWNTVRVPLPAGTLDARLSSISGSGPDDVWAVGWVALPDPDPAHPGAVIGRALVEHWNGRTWTTVPIAVTPDGPPLIASTVTSAQPDSAWLMAETVVNDDAHYAMEHWTGHRWSIFPEASSSMLPGLLLTSDRRGHLWAVGRDLDAPGAPMLVNRWDGQVWTTIPNTGGGAAIAGARAITTSAHGHNTWIVADVYWYQSLILRSSCS